MGEIMIHSKLDLLFKMTNKIQYTKKYLVFLTKSFEVGWKVFSQNIDNLQHVEDSILMKIALLHPDHLHKIGFIGDRLTKQQEIIQGRRSFTNNDVRANCSSIDIWGYDCPLHHEILVLDHDFPYSFGGPTDNAFNKRVLCRWHNMIKGNDIHTYNWSKLFEDYQYLKSCRRKHWVDLQYEKVKSLFI
jgi:hypothetical protein